MVQTAARSTELPTQVGPEGGPAVRISNLTVGYDRTPVLTDLASRAGTFVRVTGQRELMDGDEIAIGRTRLKLSIP